MPPEDVDYQKLSAFTIIPFPSLCSHLLSDLGFLLQGERHQFVSDAVFLVAVGRRRLKEEHDQKQLMDQSKILLLGSHIICDGCNPQTEARTQRDMFKENC